MKLSSIKWWQFTIVSTLIASPAYANANNATAAAAATATATDSATSASAATRAATAASAATDAVPNAATSVSKKEESIIDRASVRYSLQIIGPTLGQLDGNDGPGADLGMTHFWSLGYKVSNRVSATLTPYFSTPIRSSNLNDRDKLTFGDMYLTLFHNKLYENKKHGLRLMGYIRGYFPTSKASHDPALIGSAREQQNGKGRIRLLPSKSWLDGDLRFTLDSSFYVPFRKGGLGAGKASSVRDYYFYFFPNLSYTISNSWGTYVAYNAPLSHWKDSSSSGGSRFDRFSDGNSLEFGVEWTGVKSLLISPFIAINQGKPLKKADVAVVAQYKIL